jgi:hypothetical protein
MRTRTPLMMHLIAENSRMKWIVVMAEDERARGLLVVRVIERSYLNVAMDGDDGPWK